MFSRLSSPTYILIIFLVLFSLVIHEFAHALAADLQGDKTARYNGRLTLNPFAHLELLGVIMILFAPIGWAKPVPINPNNFRRPRIGMIVAVAAGPISNIILAILCYFLLLRFHISGVGNTILGNLAFVNIALFLFNIIPIPPLDGSQILRNLLPYRQAVSFSKLDVYGPFILIFLFITPFFQDVLGPLINGLSGMIASWFV